MGKIQKMSLSLANMISAGEVVERPSNVIKELVENSIDANSTNITIYLKNGGISSIEIIDDGEGMDEDDVLMAFVPHATSKIKNEYDLFHIKTLGFRGEAIASIASVSKMKITSSLDGIKGYYVEYKAGNKIDEGITNSNKGTSILVEGLFYNTPARLKYLKTPKQELSSILFYIDRIAMSKPELRFMVYNDEKLVFQTTGSSSYKTLIAELYGIEAAKNVIEYDYMDGGYKAKLILVKPSIYRSNKLEITMICNNRYVKNYNITNAVIDGFQTYLPIGKYPICIIYFKIDPLLVDVNVHPTKTEIKIASEFEICQKLTEEIKKALQTTTHIPERKIEKNNNISFLKESIFNNISLEDENIHYNDNTNISKVENKNDLPSIIKNNNNYKNNNDTIIDEKSLNIETKKSHFPNLEYIATIFKTYLIFQSNEGLYLVDQHAAAERYNYEKYYKILGNLNQPTTELLFPVSIHLTKEESLYLEENLDKFKEIGFTIEYLGNCDYIIRIVPLWAKLEEVNDIVYEVITFLIENRKIDVIYFRDHIAKQISCKASIKANHQLSDFEIKTLIKNLDSCDNPFTCPHGRPTMIKITISDLEKMFERIQSK